MSEPTQTFDQFFAEWKVERIAAMGFRGVDPSDREYMAGRRSRELEEIARTRGFLPELMAAAHLYGSVTSLVRDLYRMAEDRRIGPEARPD